MRGRFLIGSIVAIAVAVAALAPARSAQAWGTEVSATYACVYGKVTVTLVWSGTSPYAAGQYVEMSYTDNGWKPATTTSVGPFRPEINTMSWDGLLPITEHFLRFTEQYPDGSWDSSLTFKFVTPGCGSDGFTVTEYGSTIPQTAQPTSTPTTGQ